MAGAPLEKRGMKQLFCQQEAKKSPLATSPSPPQVYSCKPACRAAQAGSPSQLPPSHGMPGVGGPWGDGDAKPGAGVGGRFAPVTRCWGYRASLPGTAGQRGAMAAAWCYVSMAMWLVIFKTGGIYVFFSPSTSPGQHFTGARGQHQQAAIVLWGCRDVRGAMGHPHLSGTSAKPPDPNLVPAPGLGMPGAPRARVQAGQRGGQTHVCSPACSGGNI